MKRRKRLLCCSKGFLLGQINRDTLFGILEYLIVPTRERFMTEVSRVISFIVSDQVDKPKSRVRTSHIKTTVAKNRCNVYDKAYCCVDLLGSLKCWTREQDSKSCCSCSNPSWSIYRIQEGKLPIPRSINAPCRENRSYAYFRGIEILSGRISALEPSLQSLRTPPSAKIFSFIDSAISNKLSRCNNVDARQSTQIKHQNRQKERSL